MTDTLLLIGILSAWVIALVLMPRMNKKRVKKLFKPIEPGNSGTYDPSEDPERIMKGEVESFFD